MNTHPTYRIAQVLGASGESCEPIFRERPGFGSGCGSVEAHEPCPDCGADVTAKYGPDIRFSPPSTKPMMWRAECSGNCLDPSWTAFTRENALEMWDRGIRRRRDAIAAAGEAA